MAIGLCWLLNSKKNKIYPVTHTKAIKHTEGQVLDTLLDNLVHDQGEMKNRLDNLDKQITGVGGSSIKDHLNGIVASEDGIHGFRYWSGKFETYDDNKKTWIEIEQTSLGTPPNDMKAVSAVGGSDNTSVYLRGIDPDDVVSDNTVITRWAGTKIVRKVGSIPERVSDGVTVVDYQVRNQYAVNGYVDTGLAEDTLYFYRWFPYSDTGAVNVSGKDVNSDSARTQIPMILGVTANLSTNTFSRANNAEGMSAGAEFDDYEMYGHRKRCIVADDGNIIAFEGDDGYTETGVTTKKLTANHRQYPKGTSVQVMVYQPAFYYKVTPLDNLVNPYTDGRMTRQVIYQIADIPYEGFELHPAFVRNGTMVPYILTSAFESSSQQSNGNYVLDNATLGNRLASITGAKPATGGNGTATHGFTRQVARNMANARGDGWCLQDMLALSASQLLFIIEHASMDSQSVGAGNTAKTASYSDVVASGADQCVDYRGEENLWGNVWTWVDGINVYNNKIGTAYIADHGFTNGTTADPYTTTGYNFCRENGFPSALGYSGECDCLFIPVEAKGSSEGAIPDQFLSDYTNANITVVSMGGHCGNAENAGLFALSFKDQASVSSELIGARLMYIPTME